MEVDVRARCVKCRGAILSVHSFACGICRWQDQLPSRRLSSFLLQWWRGIPATDTCVPYTFTVQSSIYRRQQAVNGSRAQACNGVNLRASVVKALGEQGARVLASKGGYSGGHLTDSWWKLSARTEHRDWWITVEGYQRINC